MISGTSSRCEPDRIERPTTSTSSSRAAAAICARRQADALVDDLEPGVARRDRDLLGAVRVAVEPGLADEEAERAAELARPRPAHVLADRDHVADVRRPRRRRRRSARGTRRTPRAARPPTRRWSRRRGPASIVAGITFVAGRGDGAEARRARRRPRPASRFARHARSRAICASSTAGSTVRMCSPRRSRAATARSR